jgi:acyl carrier protein
MTTLNIVQEMLAEKFDLKPEHLVPEAKLVDLGIDSLATIEFLFQLEERFKLALNDDPTPVETVADIASEIDRLLADKPATA